MNILRKKYLINLLRHLHGLMSVDDIIKNRKAQDYIGSLFEKNPDFIFSQITLHTMHCEWTHYTQSKTSPASQESNPVILYCHGGGYISGSCTYARSMTTKLAKYTGFDVISFDYRLAPECPYPAALEDALYIYSALSTEKIILSGDSAGGNLAAALTICLNEQQKKLPLALILFSPWTDMTLSGESYLTKAELDPILNFEYIRKAAAVFLEHTSPYDYHVSPVMANLSNFPPTYIQVGEYEILFEDSLQFYKRLLQYNVYARLDIFDSMWHVFQMTPMKTSNHAMKKVAAFISYVLQLP